MKQEEKQMTIYKLSEYLTIPSRITGIYKITCIVNDKNYIGQAEDVRERTKNHVYSSNSSSMPDHNYPIHRAIAKHGIDNFEITILKKCQKSELDQLEIEYIKLYKSRVFENGYNISKGGRYVGQKTHVNEKLVYQIRELIPYGYLKREAFELFKESFPGIKISLASFQDIWNGRSWGDIHKDVYEISESDRFEIAFYHLFKTRIGDIINLIDQVGSKEEIYNRYCDLTPDSILVGILSGTFIKRDYKTLSFLYLRSSKKVRSTDSNGNSKIYNSVAAASLFTGVPMSSISGCLMDKTNHDTIRGFKFKFID
jgi:hypothetical protein